MPRPTSRARIAGPTSPEKLLALGPGPAPDKLRLQKLMVHMLR